MIIQGTAIIGTTVSSSAATVAADSYFNLVSLLLPGNGTNGAQNNTFLDSSTNNLSITRNGNTTQGTFSPFSQTGWSNYFDGTGDYLSVADSAVLDNNTTYTFECWFFQNAAGDGAIYSRGGGAASWSTTNGAQWQVFIQSGAFYVQWNTSGSPTSISTTAPAAGVWHNITVGYNGTTTRVWLDGSSLGTSTNGYTLPTTRNVTRIGFDQGSQIYLNGYVSNLRLVKGTDVYGVANTTITPPTSSLTAIANTSLLTCQSNRFIDNSANALAITANGNTAVQAFAPFDPTAAYSTTTVGGSAYFDGSGDYLQNTSITNQFDVDSGFTLEFWTYSSFYPESSGYINVGGSTVNWNATTGLYWSLFRDGSNLQWQTNLLNGLAVNVIATTAPPTNTWTHIAIGYNGTTTRMWVNGTSVGTSTQSYGKPSGTDRIQVGAFTGGAAPYFGYFSEIRFVKGTDVYGVGNTSITVPTAPLTAISGTSLLLSGTNGGITDATAKNVLETVGSAQISTAQSKFGGSSMAFDGSGDYLTFPSSQNFALGSTDFTVEYWINTTSSADDGILQISNTPGGFATSYTNGLMMAVVSGVLYYALGGSSVNTSTTINNGSWRHIAMSRSGSSLKIFVDGTQVSSATNSNSVTGTYLVVGGYYSTSFTLNGYINDLRITRGYARYTANFTPPTTAFPVQ
jgi:hypothetical protein